MLIISELPVFFVLAPATYFGILITLFFIVAGCLLAQKLNLYKKKPQERKDILLAAAIAILLGISFINRWMPSSKVAAIAGIVRLSPKTFLMIAGGLLAIASVWGIVNIITILKEILSRLPKRDSEMSDRKFYRWYFVILSLCAVLYCALLGGRYIWADEAYTFAMIKHSYAEIWHITAADVHPPLYYFILKLLTKPFHYSLISAKIVSILPYLFILSFGGMQIKKYFGKKTALLFMALFFLFPFSMGYAIEVRMYSLAAAFVFGNAVFAYRCYCEEKKSDWVIFAILGACSAYTHYFSLVSTGIVYGILLILLLVKKRKKILSWCFASLLTIILYIPWLKCFVEQLIYKVNNDYWIADITLHTLFDYVFSIFGSYTPDRIAVWAMLAYLLALIECIKSKDRFNMILCVCMLAVPVGTIAVGVLASIAVRPVFVIRYVVPAIPLLAAFLAVSARKGTGMLRLYAIFISVLAGIIGYASLFRSEYAITENALDRAYVEQWGAVDSYVVLTSSTHIQGVLSYYEPNIPIFAEPDGGNWAAVPYNNMYPINQFSKNSEKVVLLLDVGKIPSDEYSSIYHCDYIGQVNECGNLADAYRLTK